MPMTQSGTHTGTVKYLPPTNKRFSVDYVHWFRLADGKVAEKCEPCGTILPGYSNSTSFPRR